MQKLLAASVVCIALAGCGRAAHKNETAKIVFQLPNSTSASKVTAAGDVSALGVEPGDLNEINCFYVVAAGPEPAMSQLNCGQTNANNQFDTTFRGGLLYGGVPATNGVIEADVPVGPSRRFYLMGQKRASIASCVNIGTANDINDTSGTVHSKMYFLGSSDLINLSGGAAVPVTIPMTFNAAMIIDNCSGVAHAPTVASPSQAATRVYMEKASFPYFNQTLSGGICEPYLIQLRNDRQLAVPAASANVTVTLTRDLTSPTPPSLGTIALSYLLHTDCTTDTGNTSGDNDFTIPQGVTEVVRWMKSGGAGTNPIVGLYTDQAHLTAWAFSTSAEDRLVTNNQTTSSSNTAYEVVGPRLVPVGSASCYPYTISMRTFTGSYSTFSPYHFANAGSSYKVYSDAGCTAEITSSPSLTNATFYVKFTTAPFDSAQIDVESAAATPPYPTIKEVTHVGDTTNDNLVITGPTVHRRGMCQAMNVSLANQYGAAVPLAGSNNASVIVSAVGGESLISSSAGCSSPNSSLTFTFTPGMTGAVFYVIDSSGAPSAETFNIKAEWTSGGMSTGSVPILFDNSFY